MWNSNCFAICPQGPVVCLMLLISTAAAVAGDGFQYRLACGSPGAGVPESEQGLLLIGGAEAGSAGEPGATEWFLARGNGGDYLVLRSGGTGGQADWICAEFGNRVASAAELSVDSRAAANAQEVIDHVAEAEMVFIAGGDQRVYVDLWRNTALADELQQHAGGAPLAGTSAGMMIFGESWYAPVGPGVLTSEILDDPFDPFTEQIGHGDLVQPGWLERVIVDTHLDRGHGPDDETRYGRLFGLLARTVVDHGGRLPAYAIGAEEGAFIAIDDNGRARVFGNGPATGADAYFLQTDGGRPDVVEPGVPLVWTSVPAKVYKIAGAPEGSGLFSLDGWLQADGGTWLDWSTVDGAGGFNFLGGACQGCATNTPPSGVMFVDGFE